MHRCNAADELEHDDRLADAGSSVGPDLPALGEGCHQVNRFQAGLEDLGAGLLIIERWRISMDGPCHLGLNRTEVVDRCAHHVEEPAQGGAPDRHGDRATGVGHLLAAHQTLSGPKGEAADPVVADVLLDLEHQSISVGLADFHGAEQGGQFIGRKLHVNDRANHLNDFAFGAFCHRLLHLRLQRQCHHLT